ncbi:MAG: hypothetical protein ACJAVM_001140 [Sulfitobacter sp.]|jgi:hypothetical protein
MKQPSSTFIDGGTFPEPRDVLAGITKPLGQWAAAFRKSMAQGFTQMQIARMESVLHGMNDAQLNQIEVKRSEIRQHATQLITNEYTKV